MSVLCLGILAFVATGVYMLHAYPECARPGCRQIVARRDVICVLHQQERGDRFLRSVDRLDPQPLRTIIPTRKDFR